MDIADRDIAQGVCTPAAAQGAVEDISILPEFISLAAHRLGRADFNHAPMQAILVSFPMQNQCVFGQVSEGLDGTNPHAPGPLGGVGI